MYSRARKKIYLSFVLFAVVVFGGAGLVWQFLWLPLAQLGDDYRTNRLALSELEQRADLRQEFRKEFEAIQGGADRITGSLLDKNDALLFLESIEEIAQATGNTYQVKTAQETGGSSKGTSSSGIVFSIQLEGNFSDTLHFFRELKELPYLMNIINLSVKRKATFLGAGLSDQVEVQVDVKVYTQ